MTNEFLKIDENREIKFIKIELLLENKNNIKLHTPEQIELIKKSINNLGFNNIIIVDENNLILAGHGRVQALKELGKNEAPCLVINNLNENEKLQILTIDNTSTLMTGIDKDMAKLVIEMLEINEASLELTGFSVDEISNFKLDDMELPEVLSIDKQENDISRESSLKLTFGKRKVIITEEELQLLENKYLEYIEKFGVDFGFINNLLGGTK